MDAGRRPGVRLRLLAAAVIVATFLAGGLVGMAVQRGMGDDDPAPRRRGGSPNIFAPGSPLTAELELTPEQVGIIRRIVREDRAKARATFDEMEPRLRARYDSTMTAIEAVLTPEQRTEFAKIRAERQERMRGRRGGRGRRP